MPDTSHQQPGSSQAGIYQIRVRGHLGRNWAGWFEGMTVTPQANGDTLLTGPVIDQAALHGLLKKVRDLGIPLKSFMRLEPDHDDALDQVRCRGQLQETEAGP